ncbi:MAG: NAD(P)H-hydrate dehydratase [Bacteriodetes bacterium]|nr:NAD(P)H-hydrate dehydratase [Bacteroidota bacterium]
MKYLLTPKQMKDADLYGMQVLGIPSIVLMENAARSSAVIIRDIINTTEKKVVTVLCGAGNNGGDGFAISRHLHQEHEVHIVFLGSVKKMSGETKTNYLICKQLKIPISTISPQKDINAIHATIPELISHSDVIIDAIIGIGLQSNQVIRNKAGLRMIEPSTKRTLPDVMKHILRLSNSAKAVRIAIDIPTGLNEHAIVKYNSVVFNAHHTISMAVTKTTHLLEKAWDYCGKVHVADIGLPDSVIAKHSNIGILDERDVAIILPKRNKVSSKFDYGRVCVIAGSQSMPGAAALCANSAIRSGAGLVELCSTAIHPSLLPEVIPTMLTSNEHGCVGMDSWERIKSSCERADVIVLGCGLGTNDDTLNLCRNVIKHFLSTKKIVVDADALRVIQVKTFSGYTQNLVITPHVGEFKRMVDNKVVDLASNNYPIEELVVTISKQINAIVVLKNLPVIITNGKTSYWCTEGNPGMATAGSGDVLAGVISGMLCRITNTLDAAAVAVHFHAKAGSYPDGQLSQESLTASVISENLRFVMP